MNKVKDTIAELKGIPTEADLVKMLQENMLDVRFKKLDGDERVMTCTKSFDVIPKEHHPKSDKPAKQGTITVWVPDANGWRSFRYDRIVEVKGQGELSDNKSNSEEPDQSIVQTKTT